MRRLVADSKKLTSAKRWELYDAIIRNAVFVGVGWSDATQIEELGIMKSLSKAAIDSVRGLQIDSLEVLLDGNVDFLGVGAVKTVVKGDQKHPEISAASIVAKVLRDRYMEGLPQQNFTFASHKGYGTVAHREQLLRCPRTIEHREGFTDSFIA